MIRPDDEAASEGRPPFFKPRGPQRSPFPPYLYELGEIRRLLERCASRAWWTTATLELAGHPVLVVRGRAHPPSLDAGTAVDGQSEDRVPSDSCGAAFKVEFLKRRLGTLTIRWLPQFSLDTKHVLALAELASQCGRLSQRLASQQWAVQSALGAPCLIGSSTAMLALDRFIEESCADLRPVVLLGTAGNEALQTAAAIHRCGGGAEEAFVKVDLKQTLEPPRRWLDRARGGTLFLCSLGGDSGDGHQQLWGKFEQALRSMTPPDNADAPPALSQPCRLVIAQASPQAELSERWMKGLGYTSPREWISIPLPLLVQRRDDIPLLTRAALDYHGHGTESRISNVLQEWCARYHWPGNASQLEWTVARMALLAPISQLSAHDIDQHVPGLLQNCSVANAPDTPAAASDIAKWVRCIIEADRPMLDRLPAGLGRALQYLGEHYNEPISAEGLAEQSFVSESHLRFLFRDSLGISFKLLLQRLRIAHAERLLQQRPRLRVTDVALIVGFNDLSHFQKCFRQLVGKTPGEFQRRA